MLCLCQTDNNLFLTCYSKITFNNKIIFLRVDICEIICNIRNIQIKNLDYV